MQPILVQPQELSIEYREVFTSMRFLDWDKGKTVVASIYVAWVYESFYSLINYKTWLKNCQYLWTLRFNVIAPIVNRLTCLGFYLLENLITRLPTQQMAIFKSIGLLFRAFGDCFPWSMVKRQQSAIIYSRTKDDQQHSI